MLLLCHGSASHRAHGEAEEQEVLQGNQETRSGVPTVQATVIHMTAWTSLAIDMLLQDINVFIYHKLSNPRAQSGMTAPQDRWEKGYVTPMASQTD